MTTTRLGTTAGATKPTMGVFECVRTLQKACQEGRRVRFYTAALVDRLIHHSHIGIFSGESYWLTQSMQRQRTR